MLSVQRRVARVAKMCGLGTEATRTAHSPQPLPSSGEWAEEERGEGAVLELCGCPWAIWGVINHTYKLCTYWQIPAAYTLQLQINMPTALKAESRKPKAEFNF